MKHRVESRGARHVADSMSMAEKDWPANLRAFPDLQGDVVELTSSHVVVYCPKTKEFPLSVTFKDGRRIEHNIYMDSEDATLSILIPTPEETQVHMIHQYKVIEWLGQDHGEKSWVDENSLVTECTFTYSRNSTFHNHGIRIEVASHGTMSGHPSPWIPSKKARYLWSRVHATLKLPSFVAEKQRQSEDARKEKQREADETLSKFLVAADNAGLEQEATVSLLADVMDTYSGNYVYEARKDPSLLAQFPSPSSCIKTIWNVWDACMEKLLRGQSAQDDAEAIMRLCKVEAAKRFLISSKQSRSLASDDLQQARKARVALKLAHSLNMDETAEYQEILECYKHWMFLPSDWPVGELVVHGTELQAVTQGRVAPGMLFMREVASVHSFQHLFDACHKSVYTRDRKGGEVPSSLKVERVVHLMNDQVMRQYRETRERLQRHMSALMNSAEKRKSIGMYSDTFEQEFIAANLLTSQYLSQSAHGSCVSAESIDLDTCNETIAFHGTSSEAASQIAAHDFRLSFAGSSAGMLYGRGLYLAQNPSKSDEYCSADAEGLLTMLICRVLLGRIKYNAEERPDAEQLELMCRPIPAGGRKNFGFYQSVLGDREKCRGTFKEIIVFDDDLIYPEFIVKYRRIYE